MQKSCKSIDFAVSIPMIIDLADICHLYSAKPGLVLTQRIVFDYMNRSLRKLAMRHFKRVQKNCISCCTYSSKCVSFNLFRSNDRLSLLPVQMCIDVVVFVVVIVEQIISPKKQIALIPKWVVTIKLSGKHVWVYDSSVGGGGSLLQTGTLQLDDLGDRLLSRCYFVFRKQKFWTWWLIGKHVSSMGTEIGSSCDRSDRI